MSAELPIVSYAVAGCPGLTLPDHRVRPLPAPGPRGRKARLPTLAIELARCAVGDRDLPADTSVLFGTALGCLTETEAFLENLIRNNEETPMPRAFSASVHNAIASRVAIALGARGMNRTHVHGEISFIQACRFAPTDGGAPVLIGALDEFTAFVARNRFAGPAAGGCEGGAVILSVPGEPPLAVLREARFATGGDLSAWLRESGAGLRLASRELGSGEVPYPPLVGRHPSADAAATAATVALLAGELDPSVFGLESRPDRVAVGVESRLGDIGMVVLDRCS